MEIDNKAISEYLVSLAANINASEKTILTKIVEILFDDIGRGHSCSNLDDITKLINIESTDILELLVKSGLLGNVIKDAIRDPCRSEMDSIHSGNYKKCENDKVFYPLSYLKSGQLLFITKYLQYEIAIATKINALKNNNGIGITKDVKEALNYLEKQQQLNDLPNIDQLDAIKNSLEQKLSILTGGPGTGKTTTIIFLLWLFYKNYGDKLTIKIATPTGKATKRVQESIAHGIKNPDIKIDLINVLENFINKSDNFLTIHRLLGVKRHSIYFWHDENNMLDIDILIIDESSMISLPMFSKLLKAIDHNKIKHIIFLGDKNQLSSVEEGYVFATLVEKEKNAKPETNGYDLFSVIYPKTVSQLNISKRNANDIGQLAKAILTNDKLSIMKVLAAKQNVILQATSFDAIANVYTKDTAESYLTLIKNVDYRVRGNDKEKNGNHRENSGNDKIDYHPGLDPGSIMYDTMNLYKILYEAYTKQVILSVTNVGLYGTNNLNHLVEKNLKIALNTIDEWYTGRAILILENNYTYNLSNGDIGFCIKRNGKSIIVFNNMVELIPEALPQYSIAYAITIHKSQGSEYNNVNIVLNDDAKANSINELLSCELIYTAVTRAKNTVTIFGTEDALFKAIAKITHRNTGLQFLL